MFANPIKAQSLSAPSVANPVQDTSVSTALSGIADIISTLGSGSRDTGPDAWEVKAEWATEGHLAAVADAERYQTIVSTKGRQYAETWLNKTWKEREGSMVADTASEYRKVLTERVGKPREVIDREFEIQQEQSQQQHLTTLKQKGLALATADAQKYGLDVNKLTDDQLIGLALAYNGNEARSSEASRAVALATANLDLTSKQRILKSEVGANQFLSARTTEIQSTVFSVSEAIKQNPANAEKIKLAAISELELKKARALADLSSFVSNTGGDLSDVKSGQAEAVKAQYDTVIKMVRGDYGTDLLKAQLENLSFGTTLSALKNMPDETSKIILMTNATRMPIEATVRTALATDFSYDPNEQYEVIRNLGLGVVTATQNTNQKPRKYMETLVAAAPTVIKTPEAHASYAKTIVNTLQESFQAPLDIRQKASSPDALPALMGSLARSNLKGELAEPIIQAAAEEGLTPAQLWQRSSAGVIREKIAPSLLKGDPYIISNVQVKYSGGKFQLSIDEAGYRKASGLTPNPSYYSGRDETKFKIDKINRDLKVFQQVLDDQVKSYTKAVGGNPDDVGLALEEVLRLTFNLNKE